MATEDRPIYGRLIFDRFHNVKKGYRAMQLTGSRVLILSYMITPKKFELHTRGPFFAGKIFKTRISEKKRSVIDLLL